MGAVPTIAALSSGALPSGVAIIRLSGPRAFSAVKALCGHLPPARHLALCRLHDPRDARLLDTGLVTVFPAPRSFTGEDCAELQVHGSRAGVKAILSALTALPGIMLAEAGDFTRRAFENGKLDLTAIEGLGDLLAAETESQRRQALSRLEGSLAERVAQWRDLLLDLRADIEAHLDFTDEDDVPEALPPRFFAGLAHLVSDLSSAVAGYERGRLTREGFRIVLAGAPNAGKSSLLNVLAGSDLAIVTAEAGTTRDTKDVIMELDGHLVILTDTAGLRDTDSLAEAEGVRRAGRAMAEADLVLWLHAPDTHFAERPALSTPVLEIATKIDLAAPAQATGIPISAKTGEGLDHLILALKTHMQSRLGTGEPELVSHMRDRAAISQALGFVGEARAQCDQPELAAESLRSASDALARLIGLIDSETVLDRLFAGFCIGK